MHYRWISVPLSAVLLIGGSAFAADETKSAAKPESASQSKTGSTKASTQSKKPKPVEINSATAAQLKTVPGIDDADAQRIIVNRPYATRSHPVTRNVLSYETYLAVKDHIVVIPPELPKTKK